MSNSSVFEGITSLFLIMLVGIYGSKKNIITKEINKGLTDILFKISMPMLIISSFSITYSDELKGNIIKCFCYSIITLFISILISKVLLAPIKKDNKFILQFSNVFSNCGFIGFPIVESIYGKEGLIYTSVFNMVFTILIWTYGVSLYSGTVNKNDIKKVLCNPAIIAVYIGIVIMIFNINIPSMILYPIEMVGGITPPLSMIIVGCIISNIKINDYIRDCSLYYGTIVRIIIIPLLIYFVLNIIKGPSKIIKVMALLSAMPTAAMAPIFAENYEKDKGYAAVLLFITTFFSVFTIPLILTIIK